MVTESDDQYVARYLQAGRLEPSDGAHGNAVVATGQSIKVPALSHQLLHSGEAGPLLPCPKDGFIS